MMGRRPFRTFAELAVFVPIGLVAELRETIPRLMESGRERVEGRIAVARVIGEMAVKAGAEQLRTRTVDAPPDPPSVPQGLSADVMVTDLEALSTVVEARATETAAGEQVDDSEESVDPEALPIADYESLAASQVVARLPALNTVELDQVAQFEQTNRRRRTVLGKIDQLQRA